jgi:proteasome maturation protein
MYVVSGSCETSLSDRSLVSYLIQNPHMPVMPQSQSNLHLDILMGRDEIIDTPDIFLGAMPG